MSHLVLSYGNKINLMPISHFKTAFQRQCALWILRAFPPLWAGVILLEYLAMALPIQTMIFVDI